MRTKYKYIRLFLLLCTGLFITGVVAAQSGGGYDLSWWTIDGGGGTHSGGGYSLNGTIGQADASTPSSGGGYTLYNGFWAGGAVVTQTCDTPLTAVTLSGPTSGNAGQTLSFTAAPTPTNASTPITYTWSSDGLSSGQGTNQATYAWNSAGNKNVQVTASNCGTQNFSDNQTVTITLVCTQAITGASITGPSAGYTGLDYVFVAAPLPDTASTPITYTWSSDGLVSGQGSTQATYNWATTGPHTPSVTIENCSGSAMANHTITLSTASTCPAPLTAVTLSGPASGNTGQTLSFTAAPAPSNASTPITYTWSNDGLSSGQGTNQATYAWSSAGNKNVQVTASNCGAQNFSDNQTVAISLVCTQPITGATITGLSAGYTGLDYVFVAAPLPGTTSTPITYTWSSDGLVSGQGNAQATYNWSATGSHTASVSIENCGGSANANHAISLSAAPTCPAPLTGVSITGPNSGERDTTYVFTATIQPLNATSPISYAWSSSGLQSGQGSAYATYRWTQPGDYDINVSAGNCGGAHNDTHQMSIGKEMIFLPLVVRNTS